MILTSVGIDHVALCTKVADNCGRISDIKPSRDLLGGKFLTLFESVNELSGLSVTHFIFSIMYEWMITTIQVYRYCGKVSTVLLKKVNYSTIFVDGANSASRILSRGALHSHKNAWCFVFSNPDCVP
jgi:hypothetical protein